MVINQIKNLFITVLVALLVVEGDMTLGMMMAVQYIIGQLNGSIDQLINFFRQTQDARLSIERLSDIHNKDEEDIEDNKIQEIPCQRDLILSNATFSYDTTSVGEKIINGIDYQYFPANKPQS